MSTMTNYGSPKDVVMDQIKQEAAVDQARKLIDVFYMAGVLLVRLTADPRLSENERALFREMRPFT